MRAFVAVELVRPGVAGARPAPEHLTLRFLGEIPEESVARIERLLAPVGHRLAPFSVVVEGVGAFPSRSAPRVVWLGLTVGRAELERLAREVRDALAPEFGAEPGAFVPHLTLFRVRRPADRDAAIDLLEGRRPAPPAFSSRVDEFLLKESVLGPRGAVHTTRARFPLEGVPDAAP